MDYLVFRLYGPMASWGGIAVGEVRYSANYPSKSAVAGLLAAALGIPRDKRSAADETDHEAKHLNLVNAYCQAVKVLSTGHLLRDFHTAQVPDSVGNINYRTRRDELVLGRDRLGTMLSNREYRTDAHVLVAIKAGDEAMFSLNKLYQKLRQPEYLLYLGRKACVLAAPLDPQVIKAPDFKSALDTYQIKPLIPAVNDWDNDEKHLPNDAFLHYYWEGEPSDFNAAGDLDMETTQILTRNDKTLSRQRWQFIQRKENLWIESPCKEVAG